jgi:hypothetical protein
MGHQFVKSVRAKGKVYLYLAEEYSVNGKTIQKMIRRVSEEEAKELGWSSTRKSSRVYSALSTVLQIPLSETQRSHQETLLVRVWAEVDHPKTVISPQQVSFEPGQVPAARFKLPIPPAALRPTVFIAIDSTCERRGLDQQVKTQVAERKEVKPDAVPQNSESNETPIRT